MPIVSQVDVVNPKKRGPAVPASQGGVLEQDAGAMTAEGLVKVHAKSSENVAVTDLAAPSAVNCKS